MKINPRRILSTAKTASLVTAQLSTELKNQALADFAREIEGNKETLLKANQRDLKAAKGKISPVLMNRLELTPARITSIVDMVQNVGRLEDPSGRILRHVLLDEGLELVQKTVPLGVLVVVFEARPDIIPQITSLILKSGNAVVLKGGKEAHHTNMAFKDLWDRVGKRHSFLPNGWVQLVSGRDEFRSLLQHHDLIDLVIPRGSNALVSSVMKQTKAPVLGHAQGLCTMYVHESADINKAVTLVRDAKLQSPSTCNAIETLLVDRSIAQRFFQTLNETGGSEIQMLADTSVKKYLPKARTAKKKDFDTEFGDHRLAVKLVKDIREAITHINQHGSRHTDAIIAENVDAQKAFVASVDSASVMVNASTRFADGYRYGLGAEVGISTAKIHARGPAGLESLVTTKFIVQGQGHRVADYVGENPRRFIHKNLK